MSDLRRGALSFVAVAVLVVGAGALTLAVGGQSPRPASTAVPVRQWAPVDEAFLAQARTRVVPGSDATLIVTAHGVCNEAADRRDLVDLVDYAGRRHQLSTPDALWLVGIAVRVQCPEHAGALAGT